MCLPDSRGKHGNQNKLSDVEKEKTYNLTFYSVTEKKTTPLCYIWNENIAERGGQEITSCMLHYLNNLLKNIQKINFFWGYMSWIKLQYYCSCNTFLFYDKYSPRLRSKSDQSKVYGATTLSYGGRYYSRINRTGNKKNQHKNWSPTRLANFIRSAGRRNMRLLKWKINISLSSNHSFASSLRVRKSTFKKKKNPIVTKKMVPIQKRWSGKNSLHGIF